MHYIELMYEDKPEVCKAIIKDMIEVMGEIKYWEMDSKKRDFAKFWNATYPDNPMPVTDDEIRAAIKSGEFRV